VIQILLRPARAYRELTQRTGAQPWRRALFFALFLGCVVSLGTSGRVTARLVIPAAVYAGLIPLLEIGALRVLLRSGAKIDFRRAVDLFLRGHVAWLVWLLAVAAIFAFADPVDAFRWTAAPWGWSSLGLVIVWSAYIDYCFFRCISDHAQRNLMLQRAACWGIGLAIFGGGSLWPGLLGILGK
jgi:hypothetical protein